MAENAIQTREQRLKVFIDEPTHQLFVEEGGNRVFLEFARFRGREAAPIGSNEFDQHAAYWFRKKCGRRLLDKELKDLSADIVERCRFEVPPERRRFFLRVAKHDGTLYLDIGDEQRRVIAIDAAGWRLTEKAPVSFQRPGGMSALPLPEAGGRLEDLWELLPATLTQEQRWLLLGWLLTTFDPTVESPMLVLCGPAASGKSSIGTILQGLIDPSLAGLGGGLNCSDRDLRVAMSNSWLLTYDNLSKLTPSQSDTFCQRVTGGVFRARELWTNFGEVIRPIQGPVLITCISSVVEQADLLSRSLVFELPELPDEGRRGKNDVLAEYERMRPKLLGVLLDLLVAGMRVPRRGELAVTSRLGDAVGLVEGCFAGAGLPQGAFSKAVTAAQSDVLAQPLDSWPVTPYLLTRITKEEKINATVLLYELTEAVKEHHLHRHPEWPKTAAAFARQLRQNTPALKTQGLIVKPPTSHSGKGKLYHFIPVEGDKADAAETGSGSAQSDTAATTAAPAATAA